MASLASLLSSYKNRATQPAAKRSRESDIDEAALGSAKRIQDSGKKLAKITESTSSNIADGSSSIGEQSLAVQDEKKEPADMQGPPHYMILGAQKAGTMACVKNLNKHPEIFCLKEPHYFDLGWHARTPAQYRRSFLGTGKKILGEKTPELIYVDECAIRMKTVVSARTKFVLFLRDPIKRAYSAWNMNINRHFDSAPFDEVCERNFVNLNEFRSHGTAEYHYVQRGFYMDQIERFLKVFPNRDNLMIIIAEHMRDTQRAKDIYAKLFEFLGASPFDFEPEDEHVGSYSQDKAQMSPAMELKLMKVYEAHNERLFKWLGYRIEEWTSMRSIREKRESKSKVAKDKEMDQGPHVVQAPSS